MTGPRDRSGDSSDLPRDDQKLQGCTVEHIAELRASGLTDETIAEAGLYSARDRKITALLGWQMKNGPWGTCLVIPYLNPDASGAAYARVKPDYPRKGKNDRVIKYESPRGRDNRAYFPPGFAEAFKEASTILITEGEKKTLAAAQADFCCIGLPGVWTFQRKRSRNDRGKAYGLRRLIPDLEAIDWSGKTVVICFDSDLAERVDLQLAEFRLAELLLAKGATVLVARLPKLSDRKTGLDDFLVYYGDDGPAELKKLIDAADAPELPKITGPMDLAKLVLDQSFYGATGLRLRYWREDYWVFSGRCYTQISEAELSARILRWLDDRGFNAKPRLAADIVKCLAALCLVPFAWDMPCWLDGEQNGPGWLSFANGLFMIGDPSSLKSTDHTARYFTPWTVDYPFLPDADCPLWLKYLDDVLDCDVERTDLLQRWLGLLLTADTTFQKLLLLIGPPRAGKGTIVRVIESVIGQANCASPTLTGLASRFSLASLLTKAVALVPDAHIGRHTDGVRVTEVLKSIVGEDPQDIDRKYREPLNAVRLPTRFVISCNELAHFTDPSGALAARLSVIPFFNSYLGREDRSLEKRLQTERSGILNWAIVGLARLRNEGQFNIPTQSQSFHDNFTRLTSPISAFMDDCVELHSEFSETTADVYASWAGWTKANGHQRGSSARLGERLRSVNSSVERARVRLSNGNGQREYVYRGIRLTPTGSEFRTTGQQLVQGGDAR